MRFPTLLRERAEHRVGLRQRQRRQGDAVEVVRQALRAQARLRLLGHRVHVAGEGALVEQLLRLERRLVAQHHLQELQLLHVGAPAPRGRR
jgi:hypothetical protein